MWHEGEGVSDEAGLPRFLEGTLTRIIGEDPSLELGVDIGSVDEVALLGPPPSLNAFLQRVGRGGRRRQGSRVLCLARSVLEIRHFDALLSMAHGFMPELPARRYHFRPSVVQQTFSLLKQSPTGGLRLADLRASLPEMLTDEKLTDAILVDETLRGVLDHLVSEGYLTRGRPSEWRVGPGLNELADQHELYSNIGGDVLTSTMVDAYSGRPLARTHGLTRLARPCCSRADRSRSLGATGTPSRSRRASAALR